MTGVKRSGKFVTWKISVPELLAGKINLLLFDQSNGARVYGARSNLVCELLYKLIRELEEKKDGKHTNNPNLSSTGVANSSRDDRGNESAQGKT